MTGRRIAVVTNDTIARTMAGPAIRAVQLAGALADAGHDVRLASTTGAAIDDLRFRVERVDDESILSLSEWSDILVFQGWVLSGRPRLAREDKLLVADIYDPLHLETLEQARDDGEINRRLAVRNAVGVLNEQLLRADFFLCASEKQRDLWLGQLAAVGRVNPATYDQDGSLRALLDVVPFGVGDEEPVRTGPGIRGVVPGVAEGDKVVVWGGGIYNWFDPETLIRAIDRARLTVPNIRLVFMGLKHPNPDVPEMKAAVRARQVAAELGLTGVHVFFNEGWVPYDQRQNLLLDADIGVSTHHAHLETEFSFRTRMLDYFWCGLPVVTTNGDSMATLVEARGAGVTVPPGATEPLADALVRLLDDDVANASARQGSRLLADELRWSRVVEPLLRYCADAKPAADRVDPDIGPELLGVFFGANRGGGLRHDLRLVRKYLREGGVRKLAAQIRSRLGHVVAGLRRRFA